MAAEITLLVCVVSVNRTVNLRAAILHSRSEELGNFNQENENKTRGTLPLPAVLRAKSLEIRFATGGRRLIETVNSQSAFCPRR